jgi:hypothetical protein
VKRGGSLPRRTPLKARKGLGRGEGTGQPPKARKRLRPRSEERVAEDEQWRDVKLAVKARDGHECRAAALVPEVGCGGRLDPHHVWPTGRGGPRLDLANVLQCCRHHHDWIHHEHPARARELGLLQ